uniref:Small ribosomal subunit protein bS20c n=1 Tax=Haptophyceae sp. NIES-3900 TaxID=2748608 RepID=A0A7R7AHP1_9EUKA|nr:ribosomal protein S20 [Haptophyceae sp. NIES-3900]
MANTKSALKSIKKSTRNYIRNRSNKSAVRTIYKRCVNSIAEYTDDTASKVQHQLNFTYSKLDKAVKQGIYHKNKAARKKAQLARLLKLKLNN